MQRGFPKRGELRLVIVSNEKFTKVQRALNNWSVGGQLQCRNWFQRVCKRERAEKKNEKQKGAKERIEPSVHEDNCFVSRESHSSVWPVGWVSALMLSVSTAFTTRTQAAVTFCRFTADPDDNSGLSAYLEVMSDTSHVNPGPDQNITTGWHALSNCIMTRFWKEHNREDKRQVLSLLTVNMSSQIAS